MTNSHQSPLNDDDWVDSWTSLDVDTNADEGLKEAWLRAHQGEAVPSHWPDQSKYIASPQATKRVFTNPRGTMIL